MPLTSFPFKNPKTRLSLVDIVLIFFICLLIYAFIGVASMWRAPYHPHTDIQLDFLSLLKYSFFSLIRVFLGYVISLLFTLVYGYIAAKSLRLEPILIPLLDILQSVPVLGFMPGLVLALIHLFPNSNIGLELSAIFMIFTGQGWNMVFSFYSSLKNTPYEFKEIARSFHMSQWECLKKIELPLAINGLLWNSMLSMAGGWFFLMIIESFRIGNTRYSLPGIGSYMSYAYEQKNFTAVCLGIFIMLLLVILVDRCIWSPLVVWSQRFTLNQNPHNLQESSVILELLRKSIFVHKFILNINTWLRRQVVQKFSPPLLQEWWKNRKFLYLLTFVKIISFFVIVGIIIEGFFSLNKLISEVSLSRWISYFLDTFLTFGRVLLSVIIGSLWAIPLGFIIGSNRRWIRILSPTVQVLASFPSPMFFPILGYLFFRLKVPHGVASVFLMVFASQWYILFNVISGAKLIPDHYIDLSSIFMLSRWQKWKKIIFPSLFPFILNGWVTAAGGAWNACIVSEIVDYSSLEFVTRGIGTDIAFAFRAGNLSELATAISVMVTMVILINRFLWNALYRLSETKFKLEV